MSPSLFPKSPAPHAFVPVQICLRNSRTRRPRKFASCIRLVQTPRLGNGRNCVRYLMEFGFVLENRLRLAVGAATNARRCSHPLQASEWLRGNIGRVGSHPQVLRQYSCSSSLRSLLSPAQSRSCWLRRWAFLDRLPRAFTMPNMIRPICSFGASLKTGLALILSSCCR